MILVTGIRIFISPGHQGYDPIDESLLTENSMHMYIRSQ